MRFLLTAAVASKSTSSSSSSSSAVAASAAVKRTVLGSSATNGKTVKKTTTTTTTATKRTKSATPSSSSCPKTLVSWGQQCSPYCGCVVRFEVRTDPTTDCIVDSSYVAKTVMATHHGPNGALTPLLTTRTTTSSQGKQRPLLTSCSCPSLHKLSKAVVKEIQGESLARVRNMTEFQSVRSCQAFRHAVLAHWNLNRTDTHCFDVMEEAFLAMIRGSMPQPRKPHAAPSSPLPLPPPPPSVVPTEIPHKERPYAFLSASTAAIRSGPPMNGKDTTRQPQGLPQSSLSAAAAAASLELLEGYGSDGHGSFVSPSSNNNAPTVGTFQGWIDQQQDSAAAAAAATRAYPWDEISLFSEASQWDDRYDALSLEWSQNPKTTTTLMTSWESHVDEMLARATQQQELQQGTTEKEP